MLIGRSPGLSKADTLDPGIRRNLAVAKRPANVPADPDPRPWVSVSFEPPARDVQAEERAA